MRSAHPARARGLFSCVGIELEYMIVRADSLEILPLADELLERAAGPRAGEARRGPVTWCNELVRHVIEFKLSKPAASTRGLAPRFARSIDEANGLLEAMNARLLPSASHPWMDPRAGVELWPYDCAEIYEAYNRIFDCRSHGWANLQSLHINLPFSGDEEFARLHAAVRLLVPVLPALAASSPYHDGRHGGALDARLLAYGESCARLGACRGEIVPEPVRDRAAYERTILAPLYRELAPFDPEGVLQEEYSNARGAIARFSRGSVEIRVLDVQEAPRMDLAIATLAVEAARLLAAGRFGEVSAQNAVPQEALVELYGRAVLVAEEAVCDAPEILAAFGLGRARPVDLRELWRHLLDEILSSSAPGQPPGDDAWQEDAEWLLRHGCLARRLLAAAGPCPGHERLRRVYRRLAGCLAANEPFAG